MITDALLGMLSGLISWINSVRPPWSMHLPDSVSTMLSVVRGLDALLPVSEILAGISAFVALLLVLQTVKWTIKLVDWVADVLP